VQQQVYDQQETRDHISTKKSLNIEYIDDIFYCLHLKIIK